MVDMQMGTHHVVDLIDRDSRRSKALLEPVGVHHVPERTRRARLVIANTAVDQNVVMLGLQQIGLDAQHELPALPVEIATLGHPAAIFLQHLGCERWEEFQWMKKGPSCSTTRRIVISPMLNVVMAMSVSPR